MRSKWFSSEPESERFELFRKVSINGLPVERSSYSSFAGVLPISLPDGIRAIVYPDAHAPACHWGVLRGIFNFAEWFRPHLIFNSGDFNDMYALSRHPKSPKIPVPSDPQEEIEASADLLRLSMQNGPASSKEGRPFWTVIIRGNHEGREESALANFNPVWARYLSPGSRESITSAQSLMNFSADEPITFISGTGETGGFDGAALLNEHVKVKHGRMVKSIPGESARATYEKEQISIIMGHTHRLGDSAFETKNGELLFGIDGGCLVDWRRPEFDYSTLDHNWHLGFTVLIVHNGRVHAQPVPIFASPDASGQIFQWFTYCDQSGEIVVFRCLDD
ncbi:MAG: hypothetical protein IAF58_20830 [Leptolyngbya sp.]|nr:hypothetical protein [Candidatus Melainabacteria bacterium]